MSRHLVTYIGDATMPETNPEATTVFGLVLPLGVPVPVEAASDHAKSVMARLSKNRHFKVETVGAVAPAVETVSDVSDDAVAEPIRRRGRPPKVKADENDE